MVLLALLRGGRAIGTPCPSSLPPPAHKFGLQQLLGPVWQRWKVLLLDFAEHTSKHLSWQRARAAGVGHAGEEHGAVRAGGSAGVELPNLCMFLWQLCFLPFSRHCFPARLASTFLLSSGKWKLLFPSVFRVTVGGTSLSQSAACLWTSGNTGGGLGSRSFLRMG